MLAIGAVVAGIVFKGAFIGDGYEEFWKGAIFTRPDNHILDEMHHLPGWVPLLADSS